MSLPVPDRCHNTAACSDGDDEGCKAFCAPPVARDTEWLDARLRTAWSLRKIDVLAQRQFADAFAGGGEDGVGERRRGGRNRRLADAADGASAVGRTYLDHRSLAETQGFVGIEIRLLGHAVLIGQFAIDGVTESPDDAALNLILEILRV